MRHALECLPYVLPDLLLLAYSLREFPYRNVTIHQGFSVLPLLEARTQLLAQPLVQTLPGVALATPCIRRRQGSDAAKPRSLQDL
jgi:hypothetical protein